MHILVTGGSGVAGTATVGELLARGHRVRLLSRNAESDARRWKGVDAFEADVRDPESLIGAADGCDVVLHIAGIAIDDEELIEALNVGGTRNIVAAALQAGVSRFVFLSSLGADTGSSEYHRTKRAAEEIVKASSLQWTIVRPGNIYGPGDEVISLLLKMVRLLPAMPMIGDGQQPFQPLWHEDLAKALAATIARDDLGGRTLELGGKEITSTRDLIDRISRITGHDPMRVPVPAVAAAAAAVVSGAAGVNVPVDRTKLTMLLEHNVIDGENALTEVLHLAPTRLDDGLRMLAESLPEQLPDEGVGSLHHKRFFADIEGPKITTSSLLRLFREKGLTLMPVEFESETNKTQEIAVGETITGKLPLRGTFQVRVETVKPSIVLATLEGHPFSGFVEVSTMENANAVRFTIDVYARASNILDFVAMNTIGGPMQAANWKKTVQSVIDESGGTSNKGVRTESALLDEEQAKTVTQRIRKLVQQRQRQESASPAEQSPQR